MKFYPNVAVNSENLSHLTLYDNTCILNFMLNNADAAITRAFSELKERSDLQGAAQKAHVENLCAQLRSLCFRAGQMESTEEVSAACEQVIAALNETLEQMQKWIDENPGGVVRPGCV